MIRRVAALAFGLWLVAAAAWARPVELELILAVDVSASVRSEEFDLQMHGYADAFRTPQVIDAIKALGKDGIAVTMMQWANPDQREVAIPWMHVNDAASAERIKAHMTFLADDLLEGREAGTRGFDIAAAYVASQLAQIGVKPGAADGTFFQPVPMAGFRPANEGKMILGGAPLVFGEDYLPGRNPRAERTQVAAPLVFVGYGVVGSGVSPAYHAAKGAVRLLTKTTALGWAGAGVRVNSVHPGYIDTPILGDTDRDMLIGATPMGRLGKPEEIAAMVTFLASDDSSFATGAEFVVDGGYTAG